MSGVVSFYFNGPSEHMPFASIAGLLASAVCADHFDSVLVIEPEAWTNDEHEGTFLPEERDLRTTQDGYHAPVARRTRVPQYDLNHCEWEETWFDRC